MSPSIANQPFRKRYLLVAGVVALVGLVLTPAFQTWACRHALNEATAKQGMQWSVGSAAVGLFPVGVELRDVTLTHAGGTHLHLGHVAAGLTNRAWRLERFVIDTVKGVVVPSMDKTPTAASTEPISLVLDTAFVRNVNVEVRSAQAAHSLNGVQLGLTDVLWDGSTSTARPVQCRMPRCLLPEWHSLVQCVGCTDVHSRSGCPHGIGRFIAKRDHKYRIQLGALSCQLAREAWRTYGCF